MPTDPAPPPLSERSTLDQASPSSAGSFGRYKLLQRLGEGGMGEVWLAEQTEPLHRQVALKVIKAGMDTAQVVARFEAERQALALMDHPVIATVFDGGTTPQGRPYFAMEYVKGEPMTAYCDRHRLSTRERLGLFTQVCEGVQHAHQKGIIHRDLKPSNVLVTIQDDRPVPKIIDFGVAKATAQHLTERSLFTELGVLIGTPEYMSPEQAEMSGLDIDTRTDIYALGVLLYELLTGALPFDRKDLRQAGLAEIQRIIREKEPPRPSTRITQLGPASTEAAANRHTEPRRLVSELRGDLDWITMRALEKDRTRRYQTANALAADVRRHLNHEPVSAGPPSAAYRAGKFVRRHWAGTTAVALALTGLIAGGVVSTYGLVRAKEAERAAHSEAAKAKAINEFLQSTFYSAHPSLGGGRQMTVVDALAAAVPKIDTAFPDQPEIRAAVETTIGRTYLDLGLYAEAEPLLRRALTNRRQVLGPRHADVGESLYNLGALAFMKGDHDAAQARYEEALSLYRRLFGDDSMEVAETMNDLAIVLEEGKADYDGARPLLERALAIRSAHLGERHRDVAQAINNLGMLHYRKGDLDEAERLFRKALAINRDLLGADHIEVASGLNNLALVLRDKGDYDRAAELFEQTLAIDRRVLGEQAPQVGDTLNNLGADLMKAGRAAEAEKTFRGALDIHRKSLSPEHFQIATTENLLGGALIALRRFPEAEPLLTGSYTRIRAQFGPEHPRTRAAQKRVVQLYEAWGKADKAREWRAKLATQASPEPRPAEAPTAAEPRR
jgi:tetratricopeptide (TPR) repeat protein